jgi:exonuclease III
MATSNANIVRFASYNCRSVKNTIEYVRHLCNGHDIIFVQEHWLMPTELVFLDSIHNDFISYSSSAVDTESDVLLGRPYGGTAILFRRNLSACIRPVVCSNKRITAATLTIAINSTISSILIASVYMPVNDASVNADCEFENVCGSLNALITDCNVSYFILCGDLNYKFDSPRQRVTELYLNDFHGISADRYYLDQNSFTYVSDCHDTVSWIDHVIVNEFIMPRLKNFTVLYDVVASDHRPLSFAIEATANTVDEAITDDVEAVSDWKAACHNDLSSFSSCLTDLLMKCKPTMPSVCCVKDCKNVNHKTDIDLYLQLIYECIREASEKFIPIRSSKGSDYCVAGWNDLVTDKHAAARDAFLEWMSIGKPRTGWEYEIMKRSRAKFKLALRSCRQNEEQIRCDALANSYLNGTDKFWKKVKSTTNGEITKHSCGVIGDAIDVYSIVKV